MQTHNELRLTCDHIKIGKDHKAAREQNRTRKYIEVIIKMCNYTNCYTPKSTKIKND